MTVYDIIKVSCHKQVYDCNKPNPGVKLCWFWFLTDGI